MLIFINSEACKTKNMNEKNVLCAYICGCMHAYCARCVCIDASVYACVMCVGACVMCVRAYACMCVLCVHTCMHMGTSVCWKLSSKCPPGTGITALPLFSLPSQTLPGGQHAGLVGGACSSSETLGSCHSPRFVPTGCPEGQQSCHKTLNNTLVFYPPTELGLFG